MAGEGWAEPWVFPLPWPPLGDRATDVGLRPWGAGALDPEALAAGWADAEVARWTEPPTDAGVEAAARWIRGEEERRARGLAIDLVVCGIDAPARVHGEVGLVVVEPERRWAEIGYWIAPSSRGSGRASSATRLFCDWVLRELPVDRLVARTHPENPAAGRVAAAAGLVEAGQLESGTHVWVRDRPRPGDRAGTVSA